MERERESALERQVCTNVAQPQHLRACGPLWEGVCHWECVAATTGRNALLRLDLFMLS